MEPAMFHHCNNPIRFGHFEHLELPRCCVVTWHLLAANSKLVENFEPSCEYSLWCWQQRKIVSEYSQLACEWFLPWQESALSFLLRITNFKFVFPIAQSRFWTLSLMIVNNILLLFCFIIWEADCKDQLFFMELCSRNFETLLLWRTGNYLTKVIFIQSLLSF